VEFNSQNLLQKGALLYCVGKSPLWARLKGDCGR
jgi:hypothetical protein